MVAPPRFNPLAPHLILLLIALVLAGCDQPELTPIPPDGTLLAFGDSLTEGVGTSRAQSYPAVLAELSDREVINVGISGETTEQGLARFGRLLDQHQPDLVLLLEGGNDILRNLDPARTKANLAAMIEQARERGIELVLIAVPQKSLFSDAAPFYRELADDYPVVFEDDLIADLLRQVQYKSDSIHFNSQGYRVMAESLYELLVEEGAL